ncbi:MAG: glycosyltransferase family 2 protein [Patescibacteria group bacterium]|nr:glycosyltransferase family 2 protein [Patescibacteria group bacterium]
MSRVTVVLPTWNSGNFLPACLGALRQQQFRDFVLQVVDNASSDRTQPIIRELYPEARLLTNFKNVGFSRAANQGIRLARTEYVLVLTPDVTLTPDCLSELVAFADHHPDGASFGPKLFRGEGQEIEGEPVSVERGMILDSAGLRIGRSRRARNRGEGEPDGPAYQQPQAVFGCSGACVLYRKSALEAVALDGQFFDEDFFAYKEDVDLAWRLQLAGFSAWFVPAATGYHVRRFRASRGWLGKLQTRRKLPRPLRALSFKNQRLMLAKNEHWYNARRDVLPLIACEFFALVSLVLAEPFLWRSLMTLRRQLPAAMQKRRRIQAFTRVSPQDMRKWFRR